MGLQRVVLTFAARQVINNLFGDLWEVDLAMSRNIREIRRRFELAEVRKEVVEMSRDRKNKGEGGYEWEEMLLYEEETGKEPKTFTIDEGYLKFLLDMITGKDWNRFHMVTQQGTQEVEMGLTAANVEAIADLADAIHGAVSVEAEK